RTPSPPRERPQIVESPASPWDGLSNPAAGRAVSPFQTAVSLAGRCRMVGHRFVAGGGAGGRPGAGGGAGAGGVGGCFWGGGGVGTGGARGADQYALEAVVAAGRAGCARSAVFLPGAVAGARTAALVAFQALGGRVVAGRGAGRAALLGRSARLARESSGVVA